MSVSFFVKKSGGECGSFSSVSAAIASPSVIQSDIEGVANFQCDSGEYVAIQYNDGGDINETKITLNNTSDPSAAFYVASYDSSENLEYDFNNPDGSVENEDLFLPASGVPFYVVIQNVGGDSCDSFEMNLEVVPCGYDTLSESIANPFETKLDMFETTLGATAEPNKFVAIEYLSNEGYGGSTARLSVTNDSMFPGSMVVYTVDSGGSVYDSISDGDGEINDYSMGIPSGLPFYVVIENTGGSMCDPFIIQWSPPF